MKFAFRETCLALLTKEFNFFLNKIPSLSLLLRSSFIATIICFTPCVPLADTICMDCPGDDCVDKWGNPVACPPGDGDDGDDGGGDDGGGDDGPCFDKWGNPTDCPNDPCPDGTCCPAPGFGLIGHTVSPAVAEAADCGPPDDDPECHGVPYSPDTEKCCPEGILPKDEPCSCLGQLRGSLVKVTQYYTPIEQDYPMTNDVFVTLKTDSSSPHYSGVHAAGAPDTFYINQAFYQSIVSLEGWGRVTKNGVTFFIGNPSAGLWESCLNEAHGCHDNDLEKHISFASRFAPVGYLAEIYVKPTDPISGKSYFCGRIDDVGGGFPPGAAYFDIYEGPLSLSDYTSKQKKWGTISGSDGPASGSTKLKTPTYCGTGS